MAVTANWRSRRSRRRVEEVQTPRLRAAGGDEEVGKKTASDFNVFGALPVRLVHKSGN